MPKPGVGYTVANPTSSYIMEKLTNPPQRYAMHLDALPADGANWSLPRDHDAYERRYGPGTAEFGDRGFKMWYGSPQNEIGSVVADALTWWGQQHPNPEFDGRPTNVEIVDVQATNDPVWRLYLQSAREGFSAAHPVHVNDPGKPPGPYQEWNPFWGMMNYYFNDFQGGHTGRYQPHHRFLSRVTYVRMKQAFHQRWAWPMDLVVQKHQLGDEVLDAWIALLDQQGEENPIFVELQRELGG